MSPDALEKPSPVRARQPAKPPRKALLDQRELAAALKTTDRNVRAWVGQGMPRTRGRYDLAQVVDWLAQRGVGPFRGGTAAGDPAASDGKRVRTALLQLELDQRRGLLIDRAEAERRHAQIALTVRASLMSMPAIVAQQLANLPAAEVERILRARFVALCNQFREGWVPLTDAEMAEVDAIVDRRAKAPPP